MSTANINALMVIKEVDKVAVHLNNVIVVNTNINSMSERLENTIYNACYTHKKNASEKVHVNLSHCHAIAHANYNMFNILLQEDLDERMYTPYLNQWPSTI